MAVSKYYNKMPNKNNLNKNNLNKNSLNKNSLNKNSLNKNSLNKNSLNNKKFNKNTNNLLISTKKNYLSNVGKGFVNRLFSYPVRILIIINSLIMPILLFIIIYFILKYENLIMSIINKAINIEQYVQDNLILGINLIKKYIKLFNNNDEIKKFIEKVFIPAIINLTLLADKDLTQKKRNQITDYINKQLQESKYSIDYNKFKNIIDNPYLLITITIGDLCNLIKINDLPFETYFEKTINEGPFSEKEKKSILKTIIGTIDNPNYTLIYLLTHEILFFKNL